MAKQQPKKGARRVPRASEPRMYGDGKPSQPAEAQRTPVASAPTNTPRNVAAPRPAGARAAGVTPRGAGASGSFARIDRITDYSYVINDLRRLGIVAAAILAALVALGIVIR